MKRGLLLLLALVLFSACSVRREDTRNPAVCSDDSSRALRTTSDVELAEAKRRTTHVLRGQVRFTGNLDGDDGVPQDYVIVAPLELLQGDPALQSPAHAEELPLLAPSREGKLTGLMCREGDTFVFLLEIPASPPATVPHSVATVFGSQAVTVHAVLGDHERGRAVP